MPKIIEDHEGETSPEPAPFKGIDSLKFHLKKTGLTTDEMGTIIGVDRSIAYQHFERHTQPNRQAY